MNDFTPGASKYDIAPGLVVKLDRSRVVKSTGGLEYDVYLWIQLRGMLGKGRPERDRLYWVMTCLVPRIHAFKDNVKISRRRIQKDSIGTQLKYGYSVISTEMAYRYQDEDIEKFYKLLGLL